MSLSDFFISGSFYQFREERELVIFLIENGLGLLDEEMTCHDCWRSHKCTPLEYCAERGFNNVAASLIAHGAIITKKALRTATELKNKKLVALLKPKK